MADASAQRQPDPAAGGLQTGQDENQNFRSFEFPFNTPDIEGITVWYYTKSSVVTSQIVFVMPGIEQNGASYLNDWKDTADENDFLLVVPQFFPGNTPFGSLDHATKQKRVHLYNAGNVADGNGSLNPKDQWTFSAIEILFDYLVALSKNGNSTYQLYGHSAGGQFVHRFVLFMPDARYQKAIAANPGWYTMPIDDSNGKDGEAFDQYSQYPYGLKGSGITADSLKHAFERDFVLLLGDRDVQKPINRSAATMTQGINRLERGQAFFARAKKTAAQKGLDFKWNSTIAHGAIHCNAEMLQAAAAAFADPPYTPRAVFNIDPVDNCAGNQLTFRGAADLLHVFLKTGPEAKTVGKGPTPQDRLFRALRRNAGDFGSDSFSEDESPITESIWYKQAVDPAQGNQKATLPGPPSVLSVDDILSTMGLLAFGVPHIGIPLSGALGFVQRILDGIDKQARYYEKMRELKNFTPDELAEVEADIKRFISAGAIAGIESTPLAISNRLKALMIAMLPNPQDPTSTLKGFNAAWVNASRTKSSVLDRVDGLGMVWDLIENSRPFVDGSQIVIDLDLHNKPSPTDVTIMAYCSVMASVVNAIIVYSLICLMPDEALTTPGWDAASFNVGAAMQSDKWKIAPKNPDGSANPDLRSASFCWEMLNDNLDPDTGAWMARIHPETGDAVHAYHQIKKRLDHVTFDSGLKGQRDGRWFLAEHKKIDYAFPIHEIDSLDPDSVFKDQITDGQSELKDAIIKDTSDGFINTFRNFQKKLRIKWKAGDDNTVQGVEDAGTIVGLAALSIFGGLGELIGLGVGASFGIKFHQLKEDHPEYVTPWPQGPPPYDQVCWQNDEKAGDLRDARKSGFMSNTMGCYVVAWLGFLLATYAREFNYSIDPVSERSTYSITAQLYQTWSIIHDQAKAFVNVAAPPSPTHAAPGSD